MNIRMIKCIIFDNNGTLVEIEQSLRVTGLIEYFKNKNLFSSYDIGYWKPDPGLFLHAAKRMNVKPGECVVVEDSLVGIEAAKRAKMFPVYFIPEGINSNIEGVV